MHTKIMIIGAGPYGISLAYELWERNIPFVIVGKPFDLWFNHTLDTMSIRSDRHTSEIYTRKNVFNLTSFIKRYDPKKAGSIIRKRLPCQLFRAYLKEVLDKLPFDILEHKVNYVSKEGGLFTSELDNGQVISSESVVIATGITHHKIMPKPLAALEHSHVLHSWDVQEYDQWTNKKILVIGGGQSGAECVQHLADNNQIFWVMRRSPIFYSEPINLPKPIFKAVLYLSPYFYYLPASLKSKWGHKFVETTITPDMKEVMDHPNVQTMYHDAEQLGIEALGKKVYVNKLEQTFDGVVAATGYRYDVKYLLFLGEDLQQSIAAEDGVPLINFNFETSVKDLYMVGGMAEPAYGPAQRFMMGSRHVTLRLGKVLQS